MGSLMYKQRPSYPSLISAAVVLVLGAVLVCDILKQVDAGEADASSAILTGCLACGISGSLVIAAFARYQFTHLWRNPDPAFVKKRKGSRGCIDRCSKGLKKD
ncbi:hypothetical protein [Pontiella sulfatireligans]|uniref:Uncharacterized protein n=1 Tax=Pontiella sulfatireligans TaxID=2750658 RepID=A0A6C2UPP1_9BACT|nr:hypothetical protein [Pontiella sulfatireligans]VGO22245.1 hypothetical protein SCARR_04327 [Pontiella sulfatireligans]